MINHHQAKQRAVRVIRSMNLYNGVYPFVSKEREAYNQKQKAQLRMALKSLKTVQPDAVAQAWDQVVAEEYKAA